MKTFPSAIVAAAQAAARQYDVPASVSLAQYGLESAWGTRCTGKFNFFGIKAAKGAPGTLCWTHEEIGGRLVSCQQRFRDFADPEQAFAYHAFLIATLDPYEAAMKAIRAGDFAGFLKLMAARYATDAQYDAKLEHLIQVDGLRGYDIKATA